MGTKGKKRKTKTSPKNTMQTKGDVEREDQSQMKKKEVKRREKPSGGNRFQS